MSKYSSKICVYDNIKATANNDNNNKKRDESWKAYKHISLFGVVALADAIVSLLRIEEQAI